MRDHMLLRQLASAQRLHSLRVEVKDAISILACNVGVHLV